MLFVNVKSFWSALSGAWRLLNWAQSIFLPHSHPLNVPGKAACDLVYLTECKENVEENMRDRRTAPLEL
jgi:hypothetical protein